MTTTDTAAASDSSPTALEEAVTSTDPTTLSKVWGFGSGALILLGSIAGLLVGLERLDLGSANVFDGADGMFQFWSAHRVALVLLGVLLRTAVSAVYSTLSRRNAKAQTDALALCVDVAEQAGTPRLGPRKSRTSRRQ